MRPSHQVPNVTPSAASAAALNSATRDAHDSLFVGGGAITPTAAAEFCGCSLRHFERVIAPFLHVLNLAAPGARKPMPRYLIGDLAAWLLKRRQAPR